jgi:hypothetical protein
LTVQGGFTLVLQVYIYHALIKLTPSPLLSPITYLKTIKLLKQKFHNTGFGNDFLGIKYVNVTES